MPPKRFKNQLRYPEYYRTIPFLFYDRVQSKHKSVHQENLLTVEGVSETSENVNEKTNTYASNIELNDVSQSVSMVSY